MQTGDVENNVPARSSIAFATRDKRKHGKLGKLMRTAIRNLRTERLDGRKSVWRDRWSYLQGIE